MGSLNSILSELYTTDPRLSKIGFRTGSSPLTYDPFAQPVAAAAGGVMTPHGPVQLKHYQTGGVAYGPQMALYGEGSRPEAYVPLPDGRRIPVNIQAQREPAASTHADNDNRTVVVNQYITIQGNATPQAVAEMKVTAFQRLQRGAA